MPGQWPALDGAERIAKGAETVAGLNPARWHRNHSGAESAPCHKTGGERGGNVNDPKTLARLIVVLGLLGGLLAVAALLARLGGC